MTIKQVHTELLKLNPPHGFLRVACEINIYKSETKARNPSYAVFFYNPKEEMQLMNGNDLEELYHKASDMLISYANQSTTDTQRTVGTGDVQSDGSDGATLQA